ncbi:WNK protein kinase [Allomyces macrogynus ATCC 38327]|uniref:WNK protein kinase n=1 Tax=Allomyces macrogynus (strain ATCC 38327) TaxID=578462 RepID=A0A0L0T295_ALLM3|nr:WNK protein kinase [Allomyces macrogynus ATCC 38327]|eukprot:KNE68866.1 WNK protein kinase [Allomyces macrogynus ATCC 38327]
MASSSTTTSSRRAVSAASLSVPAASAADAAPRPPPPPRWDVMGSSAADLLAGAPGDDVHAGHDDDDDDDDDEEDDEHRIIQTDPSGRFQCWDICLGRGAYKEVYKAFDVEEGVEVAWNQLRADYLSRRDIHKVCGEVKLLKLLHHDNIINFFHVWAARGPDGRERVYFITELMTSGTLKSFVRKTKGKLKPKVVKNLCRHILRGLAYLHSRQPPIIHRDLKSDNIFINGNNGIAKIGDLGLATIKNKDHISSVLGTPEFMAPELYDERYDERVDIYAFGMCVLELVTKEYPYQECHNQAQIYKRVSAGIKPLALNKVADPDTREFIEICIQHDYRLRPSAVELLEHPFLATDPNGSTVGNAGGIAGSVGGLAPPVVPGAGAGGSGGGGGYSSSSAPSTAPSSVPSSYANLDDAVAAARAAVSDPTLAGGAPLARAPSVAASLERTSTTESVVSSLAVPRGPPAAAAPTPLVTLHASGPGYDVTMALISVDAAAFTANLRMTLVIGSGGAPNDVKFPFHLVDDTPALVVSEMIREGVMADVAAAARAQVESLIRHCVFGDEVAAVVLARANRADAEDVDAELLEVWMDVMQRERAMLDDESERGSDDDDRDFDDDNDDDGEGSDAGFGVASPTFAPAPPPPSMAARILAPLAYAFDVGRAVDDGHVVDDLAHPTHENVVDYRDHPSELYHGLDDGPDLDEDAFYVDHYQQQVMCQQKQGETRPGATPSHVEPPVATPPADAAATKDVPHEPPSAAASVLLAPVSEPFAPPPPPEPVAAPPPPSLAVALPSYPPISAEPVVPPHHPPPVDTSSALHRARSLDADRACLGEGAYVSAFRRAGSASAATPLASPATSTPIAATVGSATTPLAASRPTAAHASQENLRRTLSELQSLALSGFDMDRKRVSGAGAPTTVGMAAAAAAAAAAAVAAAGSKQSSPMLVPGMGVTGGAVPLMTQLPAAAAATSASSIYASPAATVPTAGMTPRDVMHAPVPLVAAAPHRSATWLPATYPGYASPAVGMSRAGTPTHTGIVMSPTSVPHAHGSNGSGAWPM